MAVKAKHDTSEYENELMRELSELGLEIVMDDDNKNTKSSDSTNIYLTSYGLDVRAGYLDSYDSIIDLLKDLKVAIINNARLDTEDRTASSIISEEMKKNNIDADIIDLNKNDFNISDYSGIYFCGGEPKHLMDAIIDNGLYDDFDEYFKNGGVVIGQSAGAMIFNEVYLDTTSGDLEFENNGFDYCDKVIVPHYDNLSRKIKTKLPESILTINDSDTLVRL
jgi:peptidase E